MSTDAVPDAGDALAAEYDLFAACLELDPAARAARLAGAEPGLAARVRRLLEVHERSESGAGDASLGGARKLALDVRGGPRIDGVLGPYRLQQKLGDGAMGEVHLAVQSEPVRRLVALKLLRPGVASAEVVARFAAERQALEVMSHPGIARILDAGEAPDGRPFFVMEYVAGLPITDYCEQKRLKLRERVRLLAAVCRAVQHAHFKGVIHRDLKPSNVLVTEIDGAAQPKIIDFGVAKLLQGVAAEPDHYTKLGQLVGTPAYMSPEQALGSPIDVDLRADVFSLGAILYELAAGSAPNRSAPGEALHAVIARVQAGEIERPSERVRRDASDAHAKACGYASPALLARALADELDWIALHALERDRARRFASAEALAADLDRHLKGAAIESRPPTALYSLRKSLRRHRLGASVAATLVGAALVFAVTVVQHNRQLQAERDRANREAATARRVTDFVADMFELADPGTAAERMVSARELLTIATRRMQERRVDEAPLTQAELLGAAGRAHQGLGLFDEARKLLDDALALRRQTGEPAEIATGLLDLATLDHVTGDYAAAEKNAREALRLREQALGAADAATLAARNTLGETLRLAGRMEPALAEYVAARRGFESAGRTDLPEYGRALFGEGSVLVAMGRVKDGEPVLRNAVEQLRRSLGELSLDTASARSNLAEAAMLRGDFDSAEALQRATLEQLRQLYGPRHPEVAMMLNNLGLMLTNAPGRAAEAVPLLEEALAQTREFRGPKHPATASMLNNLGLAEMTLGRNEQAVVHIREAVALRTEVLGPTNANTGGSKVNLAGALRNLGRPQEALRHASEGHAICSAALGATHWRCANAQRVLGETLTDLKRFDDAERELQAALASLAAAMGPEHQRTVRARDALARLERARSTAAAR